MASSYQKILDKLTPEFQGAIWLGEGPLNTNLAGFTELNYIFDGLLAEAIQHYSPEEKNTPLSLFTTSFGEKFFLHYLFEIVNFPVALFNKTPNRNKILIINANPNSKLLPENFIRNFPEFQFEVLDLI